jgi:SAM-dependent methyltransferase
MKSIDPIDVIAIQEEGAVRVGGAGFSHHQILEMVTSLVSKYPEALQQEQLLDVPRITFQLEQIQRRGLSIADLGAGIGLFTPACARLGLETYLVDDLRDPINSEYPIEQLGLHGDLGVHVVKASVQTWGEYFEDKSLEIVTCFESLEHWHHSPRRAFEEAYRVLKPGGSFFISAPNAVNLRKRISVPLGISNWSRFEDWFYADEFRGHVREPVLGDLTRLVTELGFEIDTVWGRNWQGYCGGRLNRIITKALDVPLRAIPTLCSDLYVMATKPR